MTDIPRETLRDRIAHLDPARRAQLMTRLSTGRPAPPDSNRWFLRPRPQARPGLRLFCFPYAGGGATVYRPWTTEVPPGVEVCAVQLPGREWRVHEPAHRRLEDLVDELADAIRGLTNVPFAFFGHSMGALVAYELTRLLRRQGSRPPVQLFVSAFRAPQLPNPHIRIHHLPDEVLRTVLLKDGTPAQVIRDDELMRVLLPTLRADLELCDTYRHRPEPPLDVPLHVLGGVQDVRVGRADLEAWCEHAAGEFDVAMFPGSHFFLHGSRDLVLQTVGAHLGARLGVPRGAHVSTSALAQGVVA